MNIPTHMLAVAIAAPGGPEALVAQQQAVPSIKPDEVLIRIGAAGVNGPDLAQRRGHYDPPPGASPLPGLEVAGEVVAIGDEVTNFAPGDRVMALTNGGGYAEYASVPAGQVLPLPGAWSFAHAAALPETWFTVTQTLVMRAGLAEGMWVLIHGGAGGIGGAAIQIAALLGARPIAVVSDQAKVEYCLSLGATAVINRTEDDIVEKAMAVTGGHGADRVVDIVGGDMAAVNIAASARGGHIVQISTLEGSGAKIPLRTIMAKDLILSGSTLRPQPASTKAAIAAHIRNSFLPHLSKPDWIKPGITTFPLADASAAHAVMESRNHRGKLILLTPFGAGDKLT